MKISTVYFSATNTTKTIVSYISNQISHDVKYYNVTYPILQKDIQLEPDELLILGMPVYGGRIPCTAVTAIKRFKGKHTPAILISVYGNRKYEDAFVEMQDILEDNGFFILSGAAFIAQHSIFPNTAKGRPDEKDFLSMQAFASKSKKKIEQGISKNTKSIKLPGNRPYKIAGKIPLKIKTNNLCTYCGACFKACPVAAIPKDNPYKTDFERCINCGRCIYICPNNARSYNSMLYKIASKIFGIKNRKRKEPDIFI